MKLVGNESDWENQLEDSLGIVMGYRPLNTKERLSKSVSHTAEFEINQPDSSRLSAFQPLREKSCGLRAGTMKTSWGRTVCNEDYLFLTRTHDHAANEAIWIVKKYEPEAHRVQYYKIEPGEKVGIIEVKCAQSGSRSSRVRVTYKYIGLSESGNRFVARFTKKDYNAFIEDWKRLIEAYFAKRARESIHASG